MAKVLTFRLVVSVRRRVVYREYRVSYGRNPNIMDLYSYCMRLYILSLDAHRNNSSLFVSVSVPASLCMCLSFSPPNKK